MMHLAKKDAIADDDNINDLIYLSDKYPVSYTHLTLPTKA